MEGQNNKTMESTRLEDMQRYLVSTKKTCLEELEYPSWAELVENMELDVFGKFGEYNWVPAYQIRAMYVNYPEELTNIYGEGSNEVRGWLLAMRMATNLELFDERLFEHLAHVLAMELVKLELPSTMEFSDEILVGFQELWDQRASYKTLQSVYLALANMAVSPHMLILGAFSLGEVLNLVVEHVALCFRPTVTKATVEWDLGEAKIVEAMLAEICVGLPNNKSYTSAREVRKRLRGLVKNKRSLRDASPTRK